MEDIQKLANELVDAKEEANHEYSLKWAACGEKFKVEAKLKTAEERAQAAEEKIVSKLWSYNRSGYRLTQYRTSTSTPFS